MLMNIMGAVFWNMKLQFHSVRVSEYSAVGSSRIVTYSCNCMVLDPTLMIKWVLLSV